jgi:hypothetical protein
MIRVPQLEMTPLTQTLILCPANSQAVRVIKMRTQGDILLKGSQHRPENENDQSGGRTMLIVIAI